MNHLIIGYGEIGQSIHKVLKDNHKNNVLYLDSNGSTNLKGGEDIKYIHICFPFKSNFKSYVNQYILKFNCDKVIIHSTVEIGTSKKLQVCYSPVRGVHPNIYKGLKTFVKYFAGQDKECFSHEFLKCGITIENYSGSTCSLEAAKLWDTTQYGYMIMINKYIHQFCKKNNLDFDLVYKKFNISYNNGYNRLDRSDVVRPHLNFMDGPIGGHCVIQNLKLLNCGATRLLDKLNKIILEKGVLDD